MPASPADSALYSRLLGDIETAQFFSDSWHSDRSGMASLSGWIAGLAGSLGKIGEDLILL
jgi:hypothetical protein